MERHLHEDEAWDDCGREWKAFDKPDVKEQDLIELCQLKSLQIHAKQHLQATQPSAEMNSQAITYVLLYAF